MLILTRKPGESLFIGDEVKVTVIEIKGNQIRIGISAPRETRIYREEIYLQIIEENKEAADHTEGEELGTQPFMHQVGQTAPAQASAGTGKVVVKTVSGMKLAKGKGVSSSPKGSGGFAKSNEFSVPTVEVKKRKPSDRES